MIGLYVYFRTLADDATALAALQAFGAQLAAAGWPAPALWRRPELRDGRRTWMEVHPPQPADRVDALLAAIDAAAHDTGVAALADGVRHVERFEPVVEASPPSAPPDACA